MKVIDLLNRIANGEEVPEKIKYRNRIFIYDKDNLCYVVENYNEYYDLNMSLSNHKGTDLNYEVEIIEEDKKIEKIELTNGGLTLHKIIDDIESDIPASSVERTLVYKINEIIDKINKESE